MKFLWYFKCYEYFVMNGKGNVILNPQDNYIMYLEKWNANYTSCEWNKIIVQYNILFVVIIIECFDD